jgi:Carbohydrate-selective porin, OprB family
MPIRILQRLLSCLIFPIGICGGEVQGSALTDSVLTDTTQTSVIQLTDLDRAAQPQIPSVSQLSDVAPHDWAYQALQSLADRYSCLSDSHWHQAGDRLLTRAEFAATLKDCLDRINPQISTDAANVVQQADLATLQRLQSDFSTELTALHNRIDLANAQISALESQSFSATAQLRVLSSFNLTQAFAAGDIIAEGIPLTGIKPSARLALRNPNPTTGRLEPVVDRIETDPSLTLSQSTYLIFTFSSTSQDLLTAILAMGNGDPPGNTFSSAGFTSSTAVPYTDSNPVPPLQPNQVGLLELKYSFTVNDQVQITVGPRILPFRHFDANLYTDVIKGASGLNFYQSTLANSGLSGSGAIADWFVSPQLTLQLGYLARNDAALTFYGGGDAPPNPRRGLFNGTNSILAGLVYSPDPTLNLRLFYNRTRLDAPPAAIAGTPNFPLFLTSLRGVVDDGAGGRLNDVIENNFVFNFDWSLSRRLALFGRYSYSIADINPVNPNLSGGSVRLQAVQLGLAFPDLGQEGALATLALVAPFDVMSGRRFLAAGGGNGGTEIDLEATYYYPINDNLAIIPTFFATFNSNNFSENPPVYSTILRTQFMF